MRVALLGNMNNNHFAMMRYMRDLGVEADLLLYSHEIEHFMPEHDTWDLARWSPFIKQTKLPNGIIKTFLRMSPQDVRNELGHYDRYVGNGFAPALFHKAKMELDLFVPYAVGVEYYHGGRLTFDLSSFRATKKSLSFLVYRYYQKKGLRSATRKGISSGEECILAFDALGIPNERLDIPMVYNNENDSGGDRAARKLKDYVCRMKASDFVVFSHVSHIYKNIKPIHDIKKNYILIRGFAEYVKGKGVNRPLLVLFDYGKDAPCSKSLVRELGIEDYVMWIPKLSRKEIMRLLDHVDIGGGEFGGCMWGGTGWEFLSKGIPFLQNIGMTPDDYEKRCGKPAPPIFYVSDSMTIRDVLVEMESKRPKLESMGKECKAWFEQYNGIGLAKRYVELLEEA